MVDAIKCPVGSLTEIELLQNNQYTFDVDPKVTKSEAKQWIEGFFQIKLVGINSHRPPSKKRRMGAANGHPVRYKRMIMTVRSGESIRIRSKPIKSHF